MAVDASIGLSREMARCSRCGGLISSYDFATDDLGRTLENCAHCGPVLLILRVGAPVLRKRWTPPSNSPVQVQEGPRSWSRRCTECGESFTPLKTRGTAEICSPKCKRSRVARTRKKWLKARLDQ